MAITQTTDVTWDQMAWERLSYFPFRAENYYDGFADVRPTKQSMPGSSVRFTKHTELAEATAALTEATDVTPATIADDTPVDVTLVEQGNAVGVTARLRGTSFLPVDPIKANLIGYNAGVSMDSIVRAILEAGTNVYYTDSNTARTGIAANEILDQSDEVRKVVAKLRGASVPTFNGYYAGVIHPDVSYDFRGATGAGNWRDPHVYSKPEEIWNGEMGAFEGVRFLESPRAPLFANASNGAGGAGTIDVYGTLIFGRESLAKAYSLAAGFGPQPRLVVAPVTDKLRRFTHVGWYHFVGYSIFRQESVRRIESASSIGVNA